MKRFTTGCGVVSPGVAAPTPSLFSAAIRASRRPSPRSRFSRYSAATAAIVSSSAPRARSRCTAAWPTVISYPRTCSAVLSACRCSSSRRLNRSICSYSTEAVCFAYRRFLTMVLSFLIRVFRCPRLRSVPAVGGSALSPSRFFLSLVRNRSSVDFRSVCRRSGPAAGDCEAGTMGPCRCFVAMSVSVFRGGAGVSSPMASGVLPPSGTYCSTVGRSVVLLLACVGSCVPVSSWMSSLAAWRRWRLVHRPSSSPAVRSTSLRAHFIATDGLYVPARWYSVNRPCMRSICGQDSSTVFETSSTDAVSARR